MIQTSDILRGKILIVDDQPPNVALLDQMLRRAGYVSISSTTDPEKVCELHLLNHYDLILLDLQMPRVDGWAKLTTPAGRQSDCFVDGMELGRDFSWLTAAANAPAKVRRLQRVSLRQECVTQRRNPAASSGPEDACDRRGGGQQRLYFLLEPRTRGLRVAACVAG